MPRRPRPPPGYRERVASSFARQRIMALLGARLARVAPGEVVIELPFRRDLSQQDGWPHAGVLSTIADSAGGYAAFTLMPAGSRVLTVEYKLNFLAPALGSRFAARGRVVRAGRTLTVCELEVSALEGRRRTRVAWGSQTAITVAAAPRAGRGRGERVRGGRRQPHPLQRERHLS